MDNKLIIAGKELVRGNFRNAMTVLTTKSVQSQLIQPAVYRNGSFFFGVNGADKAFIWGNYNSSLTAYQVCPVVSSIINRKAQCEVNGIVKIMDLKGKESDTAQAKSLRKLLNKPNAFQTGREFKIQGSVYEQIYGYCPVFIIKPVGYEKTYEKWIMFNIPPWMLQIRDSDQPFWKPGAKQFLSIWLTYMGTSTELNLENIYFIKEGQISSGTFQSNSSAENISMWLPDSKLLSVKQNIANLTDSLNSRGSLTRNRGPMWILTNDSTDSADAGVFPVDSKIKEQLDADFMAQYGVMSGQKKAIITDAKLKLQTVGFDVAQLQLLPSEIQDAKMIADQLNYPPYLLGLVDAKFDNQQIAERSLYTNSIIPDVVSDDEQWSEIFGLTDLGLRLYTDFNDVPALQEDMANKGKGMLYMNQALVLMFYNNLITLNRWRELANEDMVDGEDKYYYEYLAEGRTFGQVTAAKPIEEPSQNGQQTASQN